MGLNDNPDNLKNDEGFRLLKSGSKAKGLELLRLAALNGHPNALATVTWHHMLDDEIKKAIEDHELCIAKTDSWIANEKSRIDKLWLVSTNDKKSVINHYKYQVANSKSNAALAYLASGKEDIAMSLWSEAAESHGHIEARFYPLFNLCKSNPNVAIGVLKSSFRKEELKDLINTLVRVSTESSGWFSKWAAQGLEVLRTVSQGKGGLMKDATTATAASGVAFIAAKNLSKIVRDQIDESLDADSDSMDWLQDLF